MDTHDIGVVKLHLRKLLGRDPETIQTNYQGQDGYIPVYFNYAFKNNLRDVFGITEETCLRKFLGFLAKQEKDNGNSIDSDRDSSKED